MRFLKLLCIMLGCCISFFSLNAASYDSIGRLSEIIQPGGTRIAYAYDSAGNITSMTVTPGSNAVPVLTSGTTLLGRVGVIFSETLTSNEAGTTFSASGLPDGLALNSSTGLISGTPQKVGTSQVLIQLMNAGQTGNATVVIQIRPALGLISESALDGKVGVPFSQTLTSNEAGTTFSASGLPDGLALNSSTGLISGTPKMAGTSQVSIQLMNSGQTGNASVVIQIRPAVEISWPLFKGTYAGTAFAVPPASSAGTATVTITNRGQFSAVLFFKGQRISLSGTLSSTGALTRTITRANKSNLQISLSFSPLDESVTGTVSDGATMTTINANRARAIGDPASLQAGKWTFLLRPTPSSPGSAPKGDGYGIITVTKTAVGSVVGSYADGVKLSGKIILGKDDKTTFFQSLYQGKGFLAGRLSFAGAPLLTGDFFWDHPSRTNDKYFKNAFYTDLSLEGSRFTPPTFGVRAIAFSDNQNNALLTVGEGSLAASFSRVFTLNTFNLGDFSLPDDRFIFFGISTSGTFTGGFLEPTSKKYLKFGGAILQEQRLGRGYFLGVPVSGGIKLDANP